MALIDLLVDTCDIYKYTSSPDGYGQPEKNWSVDSSNNPCRLSKPKITEVQRDLQIVLVDEALFLKDTVDVTERDRVVVSGITYEVLSVSTYRGNEGDHKQLLLRTVR